MSKQIKYKVIKPMAILNNKTEAEKTVIEDRRKLCPNYERGYCVHGIKSHKCNCDCRYMNTVSF